MDAQKQGFAKGFGGEEEYPITSQAMPVAGEAAAAAGEQGEMALEAQSGDVGAAVDAVAGELPPADVLEDAGAAGEVGALEAAEGAAGDVVAAEAGDLEMSQSEKSWNGRLTARERELKAKADELEARAGELDSQKLPSYADATESLTADFGEEFMGYFKAFVVGAVKEAFDMNSKSTFGEIEAKINGITESFQGAMGQIHSEMISSAHEDFEDIAASPEFKAYVEGLDEEAKARAMEVIDSGTPRQVVKLLNAFKDTLTGAGGDDTKYDSAALDAAAGVRSAGGRAPSLGGDAVAAGGELERMRKGFYG